MTRLLIISIYNENSYYDKMLIQTNEYIKTIDKECVKFLFITYK